MNPAWGLILAGGCGSRLGGVNKARLRLGGVRLIDHLAARLAGCAKPLLIATGPEPIANGLPTGTVAIADVPGGVGGPLAGLAAASNWLSDNGICEGWLVTAAVDAPLLPDERVLGLPMAPVQRAGVQFG
jgi:molybdopterin-guanine dinucleotide biosynthesis protein A